MCGSILVTMGGSWSLQVGGTEDSRTSPSPALSPYSTTSITSIRHTWLLAVNTEVELDATDAENKFEFCYFVLKPKHLLSPQWFFFFFAKAFHRLFFFKDTDFTQSKSDIYQKCSSLCLLTCLYEYMHFFTSFSPSKDDKILTFILLLI